MRLTAIFRGCGQDGIDHWSNYAITRNIPLTEEQEKMLIAPNGMGFSELIFEYEAPPIGTTKLETHCEVKKDG